MEDLITWYQKKIGKYDNQPWEKAIEEWILYGLSHIPFNPTKPKKDLIDLDLVRGSSFTKAKPKHGFLTVFRLSTLRTLFLPFYFKWWMDQTSRRIFGILLIVYLMLGLNIFIYFNYLESENVQHNVPCSEVLVPLLMLWILSYVHSQIVATSPSLDSSKVKSSRKVHSRRYKAFRDNRTKKGAYRKTSNMSYKNGYESGKNHWARGRTSKNCSNEKNVVFQSTHDIIPCDSNKDPSILKVPIPDEGFDSFNGSGSSPSIIAEVNITEFPKDNNDTKNIRGENQRNSWLHSLNPRNVDLNNDNGPSNNGPIPNEDDGFESFTGNGSSPSECGEVDGPTTKKQQENPKEKIIEEVNQDQNSSDECETIDSPRTSKCSNVDEIDKYFHLSTQFIPHRKRKQNNCDSDSDECVKSAKDESLCASDEEGECETISTHETIANNMKSGDPIMGLTTNSDDCSYNSDITESDTQSDVDAPPNFILSPYCGPSHRVSCTIWDHNEVKKADLSVMEISSVIIGRVEITPESLDCFYIGIFLTTILSVLPIICRFCYMALDSRNEEEMQVSIMQIGHLVLGKFSDSLTEVLDALIGSHFWERQVMVTSAVQRWILGCFLFFLLAVAERTFKQRFLYAKLFSHLTSSRRARKSDLPHFRLNKVRNIKTWLSVRSYLRKRGPQRSVEVIVSAAFIVTLLLLSFMCMELLKETFVLNSQYNLEILIWSISLGIMILRFMTLGVKINKKYRNLSVLITEQINLYLQIEQKPNKKEELMVANSVLKLAADLLKELESEFKILGLSANPVFYNITKVVILSALSGVLSEILGFKLKLHKIKIK